MGGIREMSLEEIDQVGAAGIGAVVAVVAVVAGLLAVGYCGEHNRDNQSEKK